MSLPEPQLNNSQTDCIVPSVNDDGWRHQKARQQHQWLVVKFGIYIVSIFFPAMSWHLHHPYSQHLFNVITFINSTSMVNAFHLYTESHIQWSAPPCDNIHLLRMLQSSEFTGFFQTCGISISHLQALVLVPDTRSLYTQETCSKFHNLLCGLLRGYSDALSSLMVQWGSTTLSTVEFKQKVEATYTYLQPLTYLVYSNLMVTHLATLIHLIFPYVPWLSPAHL